MSRTNRMTSVKARIYFMCYRLRLVYRKHQVFQVSLSTLEADSKHVTAE